MRFTWDPVKAERNFKNHRVRFDEAQEIFSDPNLLDEFDGTHSDDEPRYRAIGMSSRRVLLVVFTEPAGDEVHLISARKATANEKKLYES